MFEQNLLLRLKPFLLLFFFSIQCAAGISAFAETVIIRDDLQSAFSERSATGAFALLDLSQSRLTLVDAHRARTRFIPASTFKIANSLIALETGAVKNEAEIIPYGGKRQRFRKWEQDMALRAAIRASNVPVFQEIARRVGVENYKQYLARFSYGNQIVGQHVERFWLDGPLHISAMEQVRFLARLAKQELPIAKRNQKIVRDIIRLEKRSDFNLYGKTGWTIAPNPDIGWFVGWVEREGSIFCFALNMDMKSRADRHKRLEIAKVLLGKLGVY